MCTAAITFQVTNRGLKEVLQVPQRLQRLFLQKLKEGEEGSGSGNNDVDTDVDADAGEESSRAWDDANANAIGNWDDVEKIDEKVLVERLYKKLVAAKELYERQQVEGTERLAYARSEMRYMQDELSAAKREAKNLQKRFESAEETLREREKEHQAEIVQVTQRAETREKERKNHKQGEKEEQQQQQEWSRLQEDLRSAKQVLEERDADLVRLTTALEERTKELAEEKERANKAQQEPKEGQMAHKDNHNNIRVADLALQIQGAVNDMQAEHEMECEKYINGNFKEQADLLSSLQSKTDLIYEQMNDLLQVERERSRETNRAQQEQGKEDAETRSESAEERGGNHSSAAGLNEDALEEKLQVGAAKLRCTLDVALWTQEISDLRQINATLHDLLQGSQRTYTQQASQFYFKMLSLRYALVVHEIKEEAKKRLQQKVEVEVEVGRNSHGEPRGNLTSSESDSEGGDSEPGSKEELLHL